MERLSGRNLLRAQVNTPILYRIFNVVFAALFFGILLLTVLYNTNTFYYFQWYWLLCAAAGGVLVTLLIYWLFTLCREPGRRTEAIVVTVLLAIFVAAQGIIGWQMRVLPTDSWDYGVVYNHAANYVLSGTLPDDYFLLFPNNTALYTFLCGFFGLLRLFGVGDFLLPSIILNMAAITGALVLLYFTCRRLFGAKLGIFALVIAFFTAPFLLYAPILYTDTLTLPIPIGMVLLWLKARSAWREGGGRGVWVRFCVLSAMAGIGALFKITILIVWIAIAIDLLLFLCGKGRGLLLLAGFGIALVLYGGGTLAVRYSPLVPGYNYSRDGLPFTHWVMMGLSGTGGYNNDDYELVLQEDTKAARRDFVADEIAERLRDMGPVGVVKHLATKLSYTFGEGSYTATYKLDQGAQTNSSLHNLFIFSGRNYGAFAYFSYGLEAAMLFWMGVAAIRSVRRKNEALTFIRVAIFGLVLFLLIWETRARYLVNFLPLFLLCAVEAGPRPRPKPMPGRAGAGEGEQVPLDEYAGAVVAAEEENLAGQPGPDYMDPSFQWERQLPKMQRDQGEVPLREAPELEEILLEIEAGPKRVVPPPITPPPEDGGPGQDLSGQDVFSLMRDEDGKT